MAQATLVIMNLNMGMWIMKHRRPRVLSASPFSQALDSHGRTFYTSL